MGLNRSPIVSLLACSMGLRSRMALVLRLDHPDQASQFHAGPCGCPAPEYERLLRNVVDNLGKHLRRAKESSLAYGRSFHFLTSIAFWTLTYAGKDSSDLSLVLRMANSDHYVSALHVGSTCRHLARRARVLCMRRRDSLEVSPTKNVVCPCHPSFGESPALRRNTSWLQSLGSLAQSRMTLSDMS